MIKAIVSQNASYIYHMLSIGKCGYDNEYGTHARKYHNSDDILTLEKLKTHITVSGGEYCGDLYTLCVSIPAAFDEPQNMFEYFDAIIDLLEGNNIEHNFKKYERIYLKSFGVNDIAITIENLKAFYDSILCLKDEIFKILKIYKSNYQIYIDYFWKDNYEKCCKVCNQVNEIVVREQYFEKWQCELDTVYKHGNFFAILCNSIANGPQAIDISNNKNIFWASDDISDICNLISHEFGIYLLKDTLLKDTPAFQDFSYYDQTEALAEFYTRKISGGHQKFIFNEEYIQYYNQKAQESPNITPKELFFLLTNKNDAK